MISSSTRRSNCKTSHLAGPEDNLIRSIRELRQRKMGLVRLKRAAVGGRYLEDAYVYKAA
jgi:hypothetical protein